MVTLEGVARVNGGAYAEAPRRRVLGERAVLNGDGGVPVHLYGTSDLHTRGGDRAGRDETQSSVTMASASSPNAANNARPAQGAGGPALERRARASDRGRANERAIGRSRPRG